MKLLVALLGFFAWLAAFLIVMRRTARANRRREEERKAAIGRGDGCADILLLGAYHANEVNRCRLEHAREDFHHHRAHPIRWTVQLDSLQLTGEKIMLQLKTGQHALVKIDPEDDKNDIVSIDGKVSFVSTDPSVFTAVPSDDGFSCDCIATPGGEGRSAQLSAVFDADRGAGVNNIATSLDVSVDFRDATHGVFTVGAAEDVPAPAPAPAPPADPATVDPAAGG